MSRIHIDLNMHRTGATRGAAIPLGSKSTLLVNPFMHVWILLTVQCYLAVWVFFIALGLSARGIRYYPKLIGNNYFTKLSYLLCYEQSWNLQYLHLYEIPHFVSCETCSAKEKFPYMFVHYNLLGFFFINLFIIFIKLEDTHNLGRCLHTMTFSGTTVTPTYRVHQTDVYMFFCLWDFPIDCVLN
jgi:hypothetical protein